MNFKWKIILTNYPFDDGEEGKVRPCLCLTNAIGPFAHVVIAYFSSQIPNDLESSDVVIDPAEPQWAGTGLKVRSVLRLHRLFTTDALLMRRTLGALPSSQHAEIEARLHTLFDL